MAQRSTSRASAKTSVGGASISIDISLCIHGRHAFDRMPCQLPEPHPKRLFGRDPATRVGRAIQLVAKRSTDDRHLVDDADRVHPVRAVPTREDAIVDVDEPADLADEASLLLELTQYRATR